MGERWFLNAVSTHTLNDSYRVDCVKLNSFLKIIRYVQPTNDQLDNFVGTSYVCDTESQVTPEIIWQVYKTDVMFLCVTRKQCETVNVAIISRLFANRRPMCTFNCGKEGQRYPIYGGMMLECTENVDKRLGVLNSMRCTVVDKKGNSLLVTIKDKLTVIHPVTIKRGGATFQYLPVAPAYARTIYRTQGHNLKSVILWFDAGYQQAGAAYVAMSRVKKANCITFLVKPCRQNVLPVY